LELVGFKSFADKTRFEFPPGITVVVGPNGSGKSNIVDAIKWVLGEQSVKSLRGKEMADVIFNGSGSRRPLNAAETTLTFDNLDGRLPIDTPQVHVTRRVYRSGEGEYLINGQARRLRDIRDLFAGTGVSTQAYSIIEQGKVDVMLQASPRDRRLIFEEAAGISRFKAKKIEAIRRLERVEQNLLRLSDIVDEVDNRLRTVRRQATKAQRYKEHADRLQELRTQVGLTDWRHLSEQLAACQQQMELLQGQVAARTEEAEDLDQQLVAGERQMEQQASEVRRCEAARAENRERMVACEAAIEHQSGRREDLQRDVERHRAQLAGLSTRSRDLGSQLETTNEDVAAAQQRYQEICDKVARIETALAELRQEHDRRYGQQREQRQAELDLVRQGSELGNEITSLETKIHAAGAILRRCADQLASLVEMWDDTAGELDQLRIREEGVGQERERCERDLRTAREELSRLQAELGDSQAELARQREAFSGASERALVLQELERQQEGVTAGVREVLAAKQESPTGPFRDVRGLVADILKVRVDMAPLIETALGDRAGYLVAEPSRVLRELLLDQQHRFAGRVGFVPTQISVAARTRGPRVDLAGRPGVIGRADRFVEAEPRYAQLAERLLGDTWIVNSLTDALNLSQVAPGQNFVTRTGEALAADGTVCVGPTSSATGLISRRSELRELTREIAELTGRIEEQTGRVERLSDGVADAHAQVATLSDRREDLLKSAAGIQRQLSAVEERQAQLDDKKTNLDNQLSQARSDRDAATTDLALLRDRRTDIEQSLAKMEETIHEHQQRLDQIEAERQQWAAELTTAKVELAKSEQQLESLAARLRQFQHDQQERQQAVAESRGLLSEAVQRVADADRQILQQESELATLYLAKETLASDLASRMGVGEQLRQQRGQAVVDLQKVRATLRKLEQDLQQQELAAGKLQLERDSLAARMLEDYQIDLAALQHEPTEEEQHEREVIEEEIADLRRKINNIGNVNLEALEELEELESRFHDLSTQFADLTQAKNSLERIIEKINEDSRRLFEETLETVRVHFQSLFRKLFGGGQADIVIDEDEDILESGLEIVARPPGKEPRSISLLSGGEKTMTCVALLLAIFRSRPSPFCVLDEVDAALDEANIERFIGVLHDFLQWTQFIVVTHSKKTMTCAGTLYGVTMQESGISKRVSVRFEDVSETGEILRTADDDADRGPADSGAQEDGTQAA
ncbi:MAG: chromosome segregation protein SMC, partial [Planctomycetales bacterium]|nr:chromosome segregation protein SMC [Planctomycetales bacterium]